MRLELRDWQKLMNDPTARKFIMWVIYDLAGVERPATGSVAQEGRRNLGIEVLQKIQELTPRQYLGMVQERLDALAHSKEKQNGRRAEAEY